MSQKILGEDGVTEIEVFTTEELQARETAVRSEVEGLWKPKVTDLETKLTEAGQRQAQRAVEMGQFRKLSDEQKAKLDEKDRLLYDNLELLNVEREKNAGSDKKAHEAAVATAIRGIVGKNEGLFTKVKDMYEAIGIEDITPDQIVTRAKAAFGALGMAQPDLLATAGFRTDGAFAPPEEKKTKVGNPDVDDARVRQGASELGLKIELTAEEKKARGITD